MTFVRDARKVLQQEVLPKLENFLSQVEYVHRSIFHDGADVQQALYSHQLRGHHGEDDDTVLQDRELEKQSYLLLIANAGAGKSFLLTFGCIKAIQRFLTDASAPFPLFLDLGHDLPAELSVENRVVP